jgi:hypothetical protein
MFLAVKLGKTLGELEDMPQLEFLKWSVYFTRIAQQQELERLKAGG